VVEVSDLEDDSSDESENDLAAILAKKSKQSNIMSKVQKKEEK